MSSKVESRQSFDYADGNGAEDSDIEVLSTEWYPDVEVDKDYWFGKKYLECIVAQDLLQRTSLHETIAGIDSKLEAVMRHYPTRQRLRVLQARGICTSEFDASHQGEDAYSALVSLTGAVIRKGSREQKTFLTSTLRNASSSAETFTDPGDDVDSGSVTGTNVNNDEQRWNLSTTTEVTNAELALYSMALKEYGDKIGLNPVYRGQTLSMYPPFYKAMTTFKEVTFIGEAKTKKQARHFAAKEACEYFEIEIPKMAD